MAAPPHLLERPAGAQILIAVGGPVVLGVICGVLALWSSAIYTVVTLLAILGGIAAGYEHPSADEGTVRGFCGGLLFGMFIIATVAVSQHHVDAKLPHPHVGLVVVTTIAGMIFGAIGGALRGRHDRREASAARPRARAA